MAFIIKLKLYMNISIKNKEKDIAEVEFLRLKNQLVAALKNIKKSPHNETQDDQQFDECIKDVLNYTAKTLPNDLEQDLLGTNNNQSSIIEVTKSCIEALQGSKKHIEGINAQLDDYNTKLNSIKNNTLTNEDEAIINSSTILELLTTYLSKSATQFSNWISASFSAIANAIARENPDPKSLKSQIKANIFTSTKNTRNTNYFKPSKFVGWSSNQDTRTKEQKISALNIAHIQSSTSSEKTKCATLSRLISKQ